MKIKPLSEPTKAKVYRVLKVLLSPILALLFVVIGGIHYLIVAKRWFVGPRKEWSRWFAWYPVRVGTWVAPLVWLEWVERRSSSPWHETQHRLPPAAQDSGDA